MANIVLMPSRIAPLASGKPSALVVHFELNELLHDSRVRLLFYDEALYRTSPLGRRVDADLLSFRLPRKGKGDPRSQLSSEPLEGWGSQVDPVVRPGSGVLLKVEGRVKRDAATRRWFFDKVDVKHEENQGELSARVQLHMITSALSTPTGAASHVGADLGWPKDDVGRANGRILARMVLVQLAQTNLPNAPQPGEQLLSSLSSDDNLAVPTDDLGAPIGLLTKTAPAVDLGRFFVKSGLSKITIGGPPPPPPTRGQSPTSRLLSPDLTGLYQEEGPTPRLLLHLNQAGHALAGWWVRPHQLPGRPSPPRLSVTSAKGGALAVRSRAEPPPAKWELTWWEGYQDPVSTFTTVPELRGGTLRLLPGAAPDQLDQRVELTLNGSGAESDTFVLRRIHDKPRWSNAAIRKEALRGKGSESLRQALEAEQLQPVAPNEWDEWSDFCSRKNTELVKRLEAWLAVPADHPERRTRREAIAELFKSRVGPVTGQYLRALLTRFHAYARADESKLVLKTRDGVQTKTLMEWLSLVVADEWEAMKKEARKLGQPEPTDRQLYGQLNEVWKKLQMPLPGRYVYSVKFESVVGKTRKAFIFGYGAHLVSARIQKETEEDGPLKRRTKDTSYDPNLIFAGVFMEGGSGLAVGLEGASLGGSSAKPGGVEFRCAFDLNQRDFDGADIAVTSIKALSVAAPPFITFKGAESSLVTLVLGSGVELRAVVETYVEFDTPKKLSDISVKKIGLSGTAINFSMGFGKLLLNLNDPFPVPPEKKATPAEDKQERDRIVESHQTRRLRVLFEHDGAILSEPSRLDLELDVAVERALFTSGAGWLYCGGYASPEGRRDVNQNLSQLRAESVLQAIKDALGPSLKLEDRRAVGWGEEASWEELLDPWGSDQHEGKLLREQFSLDDQARVLREKDDRYWEWQRVDVAVQGVLIVTLRPTREPAAAKRGSR